MLSAYRPPTIILRGGQKTLKTNLDDDSHCERDVKKPRMTSVDLKRPQKTELVKPDSVAEPAVNRTTNKKNKMEGGSMLEIGETSDEYSDENLHEKNLKWN